MYFKFSYCFHLVFSCISDLHRDTFYNTWTGKLCLLVPESFDLSEGNKE